MTLLELCQWLEATRIGTAVRESIWWFPLLNLAHMFGMMVAAGTIAFLDLRLIGSGFKRARVSEIARQLLPYTWAGFAVLFVSGSVLILSEATTLYENIFFRIKAMLLVAAGLNVLLFHTTIYRSVTAWDLEPVTPLRARVAGWVSLTCWFGLIAAGRGIGYAE